MSLHRCLTIDGIACRIAKNGFGIEQKQNIEESKFLIYEDIDTLEQLRERQAEDQREVNRLYRSKNKLEKTLPFSDEREKASAREQIGKIEEQIRKVRKDLRSEKGILKRVEEMERKEQKVGMTINVTAFRENDGYRKKQQKGGEKSERRLEIML